MMHGLDNKNYVLAVLSYLGINFEMADIVISVCHCQSDEVSFTCNIQPIELKTSVDLYVNSLSEIEVGGLNRDGLKKKIIYLLDVYDAVSGSSLEVTGRHFATSTFEYDDVCSDILSISEDDSISIGYDREEYNRLMTIDDKVLIARFALQEFWDEHFVGLINFVSESITTALHSVYTTFSDISMATYNMNEYSYSRRINSDLTLVISLQEDDYPFDMSDCYMDDVTLPSGIVISRRNNEYLISIYESYAASSNMPSIAYLKVVNEFDETLSEFSLSVFVSELAGSRFKIHDRQEVVAEFFAQLRGTLAVEASSSDAA